MFHSRFRAIVILTAIFNVASCTVYEDVSPVIRLTLSSLLPLISLELFHS